jgi:hypothetical protein
VSPESSLELVWVDHATVTTQLGGVRRRPSTASDVLHYLVAEGGALGHHATRPASSQAELGDVTAGASRDEPLKAMPAVLGLGRIATGVSSHRHRVGVCRYRLSGRDCLTALSIELADSALHAPAAGFGDDDFYPDIYDKAAVLTCRLAWNHHSPTATSAPPWRRCSCSSTSTADTGHPTRPTPTKRSTR